MTHISEPLTSVVVRRPEGTHLTPGLIVVFPCLERMRLGHYIGLQPKLSEFSEFGWFKTFQDPPD